MAFWNVKWGRITATGWISQETEHRLKGNRSTPVYTTIFAWYPVRKLLESTLTGLQTTAQECRWFLNNLRTCCSVQFSRSLCFWRLIIGFHGFFKRTILILGKGTPATANWKIAFIRRLGSDLPPSFVSNLMNAHALSLCSKEFICKWRNESRFLWCSEGKSGRTSKQMNRWRFLWYYLLKISKKVITSSSIYLSKYTQSMHISLPSKSCEFCIKQFLHNLEVISCVRVTWITQYAYYSKI